MTEESVMKKDLTNCRSRDCLWKLTQKGMLPIDVALEW